MDLHINTPAGHLCTVRLSVAATLSALKAAIEANTGAPVASQRLFQGLRELTGAGRLRDLLTTVEELLLVRRSSEQMQWLQDLEGYKRGPTSWLNRAPAEARRDKEVVLAAVGRAGHALEWASHDLRADRDVVLTAIASTGLALKYASPTLRDDRDIVLAAVSQNGFALEYASHKLRSDRDFVLAALAQNGFSRFALKCLSPKLQADPHIVLAAVSQSRRALDDLSLDALVKIGIDYGPDVVLRAVSGKKGGALMQESTRNFVLAAVAQSGGALEFVAPAFRADRAIVMAAVASDAGALAFASHDLRADLQAPPPRKRRRTKSKP